MRRERLMCVVGDERGVKVRRRCGEEEEEGGVLVLVEAVSCPDYV